MTSSMYDLFFKQMKRINESSVPSKKLSKNSQTRRPSAKHCNFGKIRRFQVEQSKLVDWSSSSTSGDSKSNSGRISSRSGSTSADEKTDISVSNAIAEIGSVVDAKITTPTSSINIDCDNANDGFDDSTTQSVVTMSMTDRLLKRKRLPQQRSTTTIAREREQAAVESPTDCKKLQVNGYIGNKDDDDDDDYYDDVDDEDDAGNSNSRKIQKRHAKDSAVSKSRRGRASEEHSVATATELIGSACFNIQQTLRVFERVLKSPKRLKSDSEDSSSGDCADFSTVDADEHIAEFERSEALLLSLLSEPDDMLDTNALQWSKVCEIVNHFQYSKRVVTIMLRFFPNFSNLKHLLDRNRKLKVELRLFKNNNRPKSAMFVTCPQIPAKATLKFSIAHFEKQFED